MRYNHFDMLPERAFRPVGKRMTLEGGKGGSPPPAPDYTGAAQATAAGNKEAAIATAAANRVNQYTPTGNMVYSSAGKDPTGNETYNLTTTLSPAQQQLQSQTEALNTGLLNKSEADVLLTFPNPIIDGVIPKTVPLKFVIPDTLKDDKIVV